MKNDNSEWREKAECKDSDPNIFVVEKGQPTAFAKSFCNRCEVKKECYSHALAEGEVGIWGGVLFNIDGKPQHKRRETSIDVIVNINDFRPRKVSNATRSKYKIITTEPTMAAHK